MSSPQVMIHMMPNDIPLFCAYYLTPEGQSYQCWEFDTLVGQPEMLGLHYPPAQRRQSAYLNALKIDAIGWFYNSPTLIECKPMLSAGAVGQVKAYHDWYYKNYGTESRMMLVGNRMSQQNRIFALEQGVEVRIVQPVDEYTVYTVTQKIRSQCIKKSIHPAILATS